MDTYSVILLIYTDDVYGGITEDVDKLFDTPNYDERRRKRPLPVGEKTKK